MTARDRVFSFLRRRQPEQGPTIDAPVGPVSLFAPPPAPVRAAAPAAAPAELAQTVSRPPGGSARPPKLRLVAHVGGLGDREADAAGWAGDADGTRRIEGFTLQAELADWRDICACQAVLPEGSLSPSVPGGAYCGSKGKALPLHGFVVIVPPDRRELESLRYEGRFEDGFRSLPLRPGELCRSPAGAALVAMRFSIAAAPPDTTESRSDTPKHQDHSKIPDPGLADLAPRHNGVFFLAPADLSRNPPVLRRVALIGSCFLQAWNLHGRNASACAFDVFTVNNAANLPASPSPDVPVSAYDFQIVQLSMRSFFHDDLLTRLPYADIAAHEKALEEAAQRMEFQLSCSLKWNIAHGLLTFVANFPLPQRNVFGVLFPRFDIRNPEHFVYLLNERLERLVRAYRNAYVLDVDRISASFGRRFIQDDIVSTTAHNSILGVPGANWNRIEPMAPFMDHYDVTWHKFLSDAIWAEALLMYRVVRQDDSVKLVIVDLDDTLWQGISGEMEQADELMLAGWPEGLTEALLYLKKRGILLAIVSKNEEQRIRAIWPRIFGRKLTLEDFSAVRINWRPKAENIAEVLGLVNLLPRNVVFIDDNPAERAAVQGAFPDIRVLGRNPYYFRRILLWSSETQTVAISEESARRTEMVQAQILREETRTTLSRESFLASAAPKVEIERIETTSHPRFARAFELINKTNQFNTTGKRWAAEQMRGFFAAGGSAFVFDVTDAFTAYGLVGVVLLQGRNIEQWVMSCRVLGLDIELSVMAHVVAQIREDGAGDITGALVPTDANFPCRDLFERCGFIQDGPVWVLSDGGALAGPAHVTLSRRKNVLF